MKKENRKMARCLTACLMMLVTVLPMRGQVRYDVTHVGPNVNTIGSETGAVLVQDSLLLYTSMQNQETSRLYLIDFSPLLTQVFQAPVSGDGTLGEGTVNMWGLNGGGMNTGNVAYDAKNEILYFTRSQTGSDGVNHIYYSKRNGKRWSKAVKMQGDVNLTEYNSTHPSVGYLPDGKTILYFSSDRPGGMGGMDIWYTILIKEGMPGNCTNLGSPVNTASNEITPFYANEEGCLYFSSDRTGGQGGFDVYSAEGMRNSWQLPHNMGKEINTKYEDLFFTLQPCRCRCQSLEGEGADNGEFVEACGFLSSNRPGSMYETDSNCCHDLYRWRRIRKPEGKETPVQQPPYSRQALDYLPLSLYFHNDEPNPHTLDTTTTLDYGLTWRKYMQMRDEYKGAQSNPIDKRKRDSVQGAVDFFFDYQVKKGYNDLIAFMELLYQDLKQGKKVVITVNGYASPLFESEYNVNLSKRRIHSLRNQLCRWNGSVLLPYLNTGSLKIEPVAYGAPGTDEVAPGDPRRDPRSMKSVYGIEAAMDRRIDIIDYRYF